MWTPPAPALRLRRVRARWVLISSSSNRVTDIKQLPNGEWEVLTEQGNVVCEHVVNAGGTYARQIGEWVGLDLPIANTTHHYVVTETVPEFLDLSVELPVIRDASAFSGYCRMEQKSGLIGIYEKEHPNTIWDDGVPWEAEHELFEPASRSHCAMARDRHGAHAGL